MDTQTQKFYSDNHKTLHAKYNCAGEGVCKYFEQAFLSGCSVLDIGCGSGRDLNTLISKGYEAVGVDCCDEFITSVSDYYPALKGRASKDALPGLKTISDDAFDGVLCSAVLMHLPEELLFDSVYSIRRIIKENGRLLISVPNDLPYEGNRDKHGRLFNGVTPDNFQLIFERIGFRLINWWDDDDSLGRQERHWATMLFSLETTDGGSMS